MKPNFNQILFHYILFLLFIFAIDTGIGAPLDNILAKNDINLKPPKKISYRGISSNKQTVWISGNNGTVLKLKSPENLSSNDFIESTNSQKDSITIQNNSLSISLINAFSKSKNKSHKSEFSIIPNRSSTNNFPTLQFELKHETWDTVSPKGFENSDFRDVESLDDNTAIIMSVGDSSRILKTSNGGKTWVVVYENSSPNVFLDAIDIDWKSGFGFAIGDPQTQTELMIGDRINNTNLSSKIPPSSMDNKKYYLMLYTLDSGNTWYRIPNINALIPPDTIAAFFAGSGSSLHIIQSHIKRNKFNNIKKINILVGMAGGGIIPEFRVIKLQTIKYRINVKSSIQNNTMIIHNTLSNKKPIIDNSSTLTTKSYIHSNRKLIYRQPFVTNQLLLSITNQTFPISMKGGAGWGIYGGYYNEANFYWVGGNYMYPNWGDSTVCVFPKSEINRLKKNKIIPSSLSSNTASSSGYKSGICQYNFQNKILLFAAGINGLNYSVDQGNNWELLTPANMDKLSHLQENKKNELHISSILLGINTITCFQKNLIIIGNNDPIVYSEILRKKK